MSLKNQKRKVEAVKKRAWEDEIDTKAILDKYGPEGCYEIAEELKEMAYLDMQEGVEQAIRSNMSNCGSTTIGPWCIGCDTKDICKLYQSESDHEKNKLSDDEIKQESTGDIEKDCSRLIKEINKNNLPDFPYEIDPPEYKVCETCLHESSSVCVSCDENRKDWESKKK